MHTHMAPSAIAKDPICCIVVHTATAHRLREQCAATTSAVRVAGRPQHHRRRASIRPDEGVDQRMAVKAQLILIFGAVPHSLHKIPQRRRHHIWIEAHQSLR
jgi:hypothetical protein